MNKNTNIKLSIVIVSYNSLTFLRECLESIVQNPPECSSNIIVSDNASADGSVEMLEKYFNNIKLIKNVKNVGFAKAANIAIMTSDSEYILLLNSDCQVFKGSLDGLVSFMDEYTEAGVQGPKIVNSDGSLQYSCRSFPSFIDAGMHALLVNITPDNRFTRRYKLLDTKRDKPFEVDWVSGSSMLIRRAALDETGLLDENYFMYVEDTDLCYRMWQKGWKVIYNPGTCIMHHIGGSTKNERNRASIRMQKSALYFFWKNNKKTPKVLLLPVILMVLGLRILLTFIKNLLK